MLEFITVNANEAETDTNVFSDKVIYKDGKVIYLYSRVGCVRFPSPECIYKSVYENGTWIEKYNEYIITLDVASYYA